MFDWKANVGASSALTTLTVSLAGLPISRQTVIVYAVSLGSPTVQVTGVAGTTPTAGTFVRALRQAGTTRALEVWYGYGFGGLKPANVTATFAASTGGLNTGFAFALEVSYDTSIVPTFTATGATGTGTAAASGSVTAALGDYLFTGCGPAGASPTVHTLSPTPSKAYGVYASAPALAVDLAEANTAGATSGAWTLPVSVEWVAGVIKWTPPADPASSASLLTKGLDTAALDAASAF